MQNDNNSSTEITTKISADTRRSFLKKAAIGAPIVLASTAKPAWATPACTSGIMSGNLSNHTHTCNLSGGLSHGHWKEHYVTGVAPVTGNGKSTAPDVTFKDHYYVKDGQTYTYSSGNFKINTPFDGSDFQSLLVNGTRFQREIVTAFLNADNTSLNYPYTVQDVYEIYEMVNNGDAEESAISDLLEGIHQAAHI